MFLVNKTNEDAILLRHVIGFDEPLTMSQIRETTSTETDKTKWSKNAQILNSLMKSYQQMQSGGGKIIQKGGYGEMNLQAFTKFVNCGQYRDKSQNIFDCVNVKIPDTSGTSGTSGTVPMATATPVDDGNITLEVNEKQYSSDIKMVTVNMFVPNQSKVIVKNYAHNTEAEMTSSLPAGLPAPGSSIPGIASAASPDSSSDASSGTTSNDSASSDASSRTTSNASGSTSSGASSVPSSNTSSVPSSNASPDSSSRTTSNASGSSVASSSGIETAPDRKESTISSSTKSTADFMVPEIDPTKIGWNEID
jgi:hypothetical protein